MPSTIFSKPLNKQVAQNAADIAALNASMGNANGAIAIVATGNTAPKAIPAGQFVLWSGGLYTANSAIASGETLSSSNLTAVPDGGLNAVKSAIPAVVNNLTSDSTTSALSAAQGKALNSNKAYFSTVLKDTRLPSTNQQIENILIGTSRNIMYLGNTDTIDDVIVQTNNGDVSIPSLNSRSVMPRGEPSSADVNTCTTPGSYLKFTAPTNGPSGYSDSFILLVYSMGIGGAILQILIPWSTTYKKMYMRTYVNNTWQSWMTLSAT